MSNCHHILTSSTQQQNRPFHVVETTRTPAKYLKIKNARVKQAKLLFFIVTSSTLRRSCCCGRRGCISSIILFLRLTGRTSRSARLNSIFHIFLLGRLLKISLKGRSIYLRVEGMISYDVLSRESCVRFKIIQMIVYEV